MSDTRLAPRHLGYGLYWMWTLLCFQSTVAFMPFGGGFESVLSSHGEFFGSSLVATVLAHPLWALVSAGFLALPSFINSGTQAGLTAAVVLINVGTMVIDVVVMCAIAHAAFDWQTSGAIVGGLARGITVGMIMAGHAAGGFLAESIWSGSVDIVVFIVSVTYLLILCCSLYLSHMRGVREDDPQHLADTTEQVQDQTVEPVDDSAGQRDADGMQLQANEAAGSPFAQRIEALAFEYHLSRREADVFGLIARGRSIPYVAGALAISENTVRSHVRRIYDKFGVHSKQELLDLVEGLG